MGPGLFERLAAIQHAREVEALRRRLSADDNMGPIFLDPEHPTVNLDPVPFMWGPAITNPAPTGYRPTEQVGPAPPVNSPFASVLGKR